MKHLIGIHMSNYKFHDDFDFKSSFMKEKEKSKLYRELYSYILQLPILRFMQLNIKISLNFPAFLIFDRQL